MNKIIRLLITTFFSLSFISCGGGDRKEELMAYVSDIKSKSIGQVEPLPEVKPYETFSYSALNIRSPFVPPKPVEVLADLPEDNGIRPDVNRAKEALESYPLDSLRMVGTLEQQGAIWAVIVDSDGTVHRISEGNYVGQNHGFIDKITEEKIFITEIVTDGRGGWMEREAEMALLQEE